jgi:hypothetical protein
MKRRTFMALVSGGLLVAPLAAEGQKPELVATWSRKLTPKPFWA